MPNQTVSVQAKVTNTDCFAHDVAPRLKVGDVVTLTVYNTSDDDYTTGLGHGNWGRLGHAYELTEEWV